MKKYFKTFLLFFFLATLQNNSYADIPHYIDFKFILNNSVAGKKAQTELKKNYEKNINALMQKEKKIQEEEKKIIQQKKLMKPDEYKKKVNELRTKVSKLQKERKDLLENIAKKRSKARTELLTSIGLDVTKVEKKGITLPVISSHCDYKKGAKFEQHILVKTYIASVPKSKLHIDYCVFIENEKDFIARGYTEHAFLNSRGQAVRAPKIILEHLNQKDTKSFSD